MADISEYPTVFVDQQGEECHESLLQSFQILEKVKDLLRIETPASVVLEIIEECQLRSTGGVFCCVEGWHDRYVDPRTGKNVKCPKCGRAQLAVLAARLSDAAGEKLNESRA
jgi:hypothetical protein